MCCPGCAAVAAAIVAAGLTDYYRFREAPGNRPDDLVPEALRELEVLDDPDVQRDFVRSEDGSMREATLVIDGISCAACGWPPHQSQSSRTAPLPEHWFERRQAARASSGCREICPAQ